MFVSCYLDLCRKWLFKSSGSRSNRLIEDLSTMLNRFQVLQQKNANYAWT